MNRNKLVIVFAGLIALAGCASQHGRIAPPGSSGPPPNPAGSTSGAAPRPAPPPATTTTPQQPTPPSQQQGAASSATSGAGNGTPSTPQPKPPPKTASDASSPAVMSLINSADSLAGAGHLEPAAATLERALDLQPRNPFIYQRLAAVRLAEGENGQAEQLAMKSNSVAGRNPYVEAGNWQIIAKARQAGGNSAGARRARARAVNYQQSTDTNAQ